MTGDYIPDETRKRGEPMYVCEVNPHQRIANLKDGDGNWRCEGCGLTGKLEEIDKVACPVVQPPCKHCGLTPICAWDCKGIGAILGDPKVYIAGGHHDQ